MELITTESQSETVRRLLDAYRDAPDDTDIDIHLADTEREGKAVVIKIGEEYFPIFLSNARRLAAKLEDAGMIFGIPEEFANLVDAIRVACDVAERGHD